MGGKSSKRSATGRYASYNSGSYSGHYGYSQPYPQPSYNYAPPPPHQAYGGPPPESRKRLERKFSKIEDNYHTLEQVN